MRKEKNMYWYYIKCNININNILITCSLIIFNINIYLLKPTIMVIEVVGEEGE